MDEKEKPKALFPPEYSFLEDSLRVTQGKLSEMDQRIENLPKDRGHRPDFKPPGDYKRNDRGDQLSSKEELEHEKQRIKEEYKDATDVRIKYATPNQVAQIRQMIDYQLTENEFIKKDRNYLKADQKGQKDFVKSFDYMAAKHYVKFGTVGPPLRAHESIVHDPKYNVDKMGERFLKKLNYPENKSLKESEMSMDREFERQNYQSLITAKEKEEPDLDKD